MAIATGRSYAMSKEIMESFDLHNMVHDGGYGFTINDKMIEVKPLDFDKCVRLIEECEQKGFPWSFSPYINKTRLMPDDSFIKATDADDYLENIVVDGLDIHDYKQIYKIYIACKTPEEKRLEALKDMDWCRYVESYFFVEPTDKSEGIKRVMEYFSAPLEDVVVFGDELNDLSMFNDKWICIAMGNADPGLKKVATYVTDDVLEDGIYNACKKFGWI